MSAHVPGCRCADCIDAENRVILDAQFGASGQPSSAVSGDASEPAHHSLKTDPAVFEAVWSGAKTFEIRLNDRGFKVGDVLNLRETTHTGAEIAHGAPLVYTGRELDKRVSHVLTGYGLIEGWCCLSFEPDLASQASLAKRGTEPSLDAEAKKRIAANVYAHCAQIPGANSYTAAEFAITETLKTLAESAPSEKLSGAEPALYVSPEQLAGIKEPEGEHGAYLPIRKTPAGKFTQPLYASHAETVPHVPAPMVDRQGSVLAVGDTIRHPESGETATVQLDPKREGLGQWRAVYANGESLWLGNQVERGEAVKVSHAQTVPQVPAAFLRRVDAAAEVLSKVLAFVKMPAYEAEVSRALSGLRAVQSNSLQPEAAGAAQPSEAEDAARYRTLKKTLETGARFDFANHWDYQCNSVYAAPYEMDRWLDAARTPTDAGGVKG